MRVGKFWMYAQIYSHYAKVKKLEVGKAFSLTLSANHTNLIFLNFLKIRCIMQAIYFMIQVSLDVWMWELDCEEIWALKNWCFWTVVLEKTLESPLDCKRSNQSILKINPGISLEGMMLKLKLQYCGHLMRRADLLEKTNAGRDWGQEEKGPTEDEMAGWHHWLDGH